MLYDIILIIPNLKKNPSSYSYDAIFAGSYYIIFQRVLPDYTKFSKWIFLGAYFLTSSAN